MVDRRSPRETSPLPQKFQRLQERQAEHRKIISVDALEELDTDAFQLISTHARSRGISGSFQIKIEKFFRKCPHGQPCDADMFKQYRAVLDKGDGRVQLMGAP